VCERRSILAIFVGTTCPACRGRKQIRTAFCGNCYHSLPLPMKSDLWRRFGQGFEEAFHEGLAWLNNRKRQLELRGL